MVNCESPCAEEVAVLNTTISPNKKSIFVPVSALHFPNLTFSPHVDCSSSHCFVDNHYAKSNHFLIVSILPIPLCLIDGAIHSVITHATTIPVQFSCGTVYTIKFLLTSLDSDFPAVLGLDWLTQHNLLIDWVKCSVTF